MRELKCHCDTQHIPVFALTDYNTPEMRESSLEAGYDDFIKPMTPAGSRIKSQSSTNNFQSPKITIRPRKHNRTISPTSA